MQVQIIRTDGREETLDLPLDKVFAEIERLINATALDTLSLRDGRVMLVDDTKITLIEQVSGVVSISGLKLKPVNQKATALYRRERVAAERHRINGDVAIVRDADFAQ